MKKLLLVGLLAVSTAGGSARAAEIAIHANTAGELASLCGANPRESSGIARINFCHGFAQGALDVERRRAEEQRLFCFPSNPPNREVVMNQYVRWVRDSPERADQSALSGLFHFFGERFPCK